MASQPDACCCDRATVTLVRACKAAFLSTSIYKLIQLYRLFLPSFLLLLSSCVGLKVRVGCSFVFISWSHGGLFVNKKLDAVVVSILLVDNANLGLIEEQLGSLETILKPFSNANFLNHNI